jgi:hypothetical protein
MQPFPEPETSPAVRADRAAQHSAELASWIETALAGARRAPHDAAPVGTAADRRDAILRALAQRIYPGVPVSTQAARLSALAGAYALSGRPRDCARPSALRGDLTDAYLWAAFNCGAPMPLAPRDLRRILVGIGED